MLSLLLLGCVATKNVKRINVPQAAELSLCPGQAFDVNVVARMKDGRRKRTSGSGREKLPWRELVVRFDGRDVEQGRVVMPSDPRETLDRAVPLRVYLADRGEVSWEGIVTARYDCVYTADFSGASGAVGDNWVRYSGDDGDDGWDTTRPGERGGDGGDGRHGQHGGDGGDGGDGGTVTVQWGTLDHHGVSMITAVAKGTVPGRSTEPQWFLIDPNGGSLVVDVRGGAGGAGEDGQPGGDGGNGGDGEPDGRGGDGGDGGHGGDGGDGGDAGWVRVISDPAAEAWLGHMHIDNVGGAAGAAGLAGDPGDGGWGDPSGRDGRWGDAGRVGRAGASGADPEVALKPLPAAW
jgi:hypothetical protein